MMDNSNSSRKGSRGGWRGKNRSSGHTRHKESDLSPKSEAPQRVDPDSDILKLFRGFGEELDEKHDRNERIFKLTRDVTIDSKRVIFTLHRATGAPECQRKEIFAEAEEKLANIRNDKFKKIAEEIKNVEIYQHLKSITWGYQEYIEAVSFLHYLKGDGLLSQNTADNDFHFTSETAEPISLILPPTEFYLGIADLTGELMRLSIIATSQGDLKTPFEVVKFMRQIYTGFLLIGNQGPKEMGRKCKVLKQSLEKVERACYTLRVRGSEIPTHMLADVFKGYSDPDQDEGFEAD